MDQSWFLVVSSLLQILVCSCSVLNVIDPGMLMLAHLFPIITFWPSDNKVSSIGTLLCVVYLSLFPFTVSVFLVEAVQGCTEPVCLVAYS
jgi:hypothetical protein